MYACRMRGERQRDLAADIIFVKQEMAPNAVTSQLMREIGG